MGYSNWKRVLDRSTSQLFLLAVTLLTYIPYSNCNEFIHGSSNVGMPTTVPVFNKEPDDYYYIVKNKPEIVSCVAVGADEIRIKCSDVWITDTVKTHVEINRLTKVKTITSSIEVTKDDLEEYFGKETYWCECHATANIHGTDSPTTTISKRGQIQAAYLRRFFERQPISKRVQLDQFARLQCLPPEGKPLPEVFWLKDGEEIDVLTTNYIVSSEGDLMIGQVRLADMGNYTCGARNIVTKRTSDSATLTVFVDGGWSTWSPWSECSTKCGKGYQRRSRTCSNPTPLNGGTECSGQVVQKQSCNSICPVKGQWSPWSSWSTCSPDCIYHRRRSCDNPRPANGGSYCNGNDLDSNNCTGGMCRGSKRKSGSGNKNNNRPLVPSLSNIDSNSDTSHGDRDGRRGFINNYPISEPEKEATTTAESGDENIAMYIGLCVALVVFAMLIVVIIVVIRRWRTHQLLDTNHPGMSEDEKKVNKNGTDMVSVQPDLTQTMVAVANHSHTPSPTMDPPSPNNNHLGSTENIYDKPDFNLEHRLSLGKGSKTLFVEPTINLNRTLEQLPLNDQNTMSHVPNGASTPPQLPPRPHSENDNLMDSRHSMMSVQLPSNIDMESVAWGTFNHMGGRLILPESGVMLTVPEGAIKKGQTEEMFLAVCRDDKDRPKLSDRQTILSPVVLCGPSHISLKKPIVISLQHCANMRQGGWMLSVCHSDSALDEAPEWLRTVTLGQETINTPVYAQLDPNHCHIMTEFLRRYTLIGESVPGARPVKILRLAAFAPQVPPSMDFSIRVYVVEDTQDALEGVIQEEKKFGGRLLDKPKQIPFQDGGHNLCLTIEELSPGWRSKLAANYQEIPFQHIWSGNQNSLHCSFSLEMIDRGVHKISCKIQVYQKAILSNRQVLHIHNSFSEKSTSCQTPSSTLKGRSSTVTTNSSSGFSSMVTLDRDPSAQGFRLPSHVRHMLCLLLDQPNARGNDWRMLAQALTVDRYVQYFATKNSPTEHILDLWEARHREESAITDLMNIFRVMGRIDAAAVLEKDMGAWL